MGILESIALTIVASIGTTSVIASNLIYLGTMAALYGGLAYGAGVLQSLLVQKPAIPRPDDGSYNLKQNVPPLPIVYGRVKKGGDYVFLEQSGGTAFHIIVWSGRRIHGFFQHFLHDEDVILDSSGDVSGPDHFRKGGTNYVNIQTRLGLDAESAYGDATAAFPGAWTLDHRGDGLASVLMRVQTPPDKYYMQVFPNQMPEHSAVGDGALLYDPRKDSEQPGGIGSHRWNDPNSWQFSRNIALMRLDHLAQPFGGKLGFERMYMPEWMHAADVCDQIVTNRSGGTEPRYHGGMWFRTNNDPVEVGRTLDEAAELIVYERSDGLIGVHAGEYVTPDIRLTEADIFAIEVDKNKRLASTVLAVRGRYQNPASRYNTEDAALYGDPYAEFDDTERTKTLDNVAIQSHNHCQRKQKLTFIRANARRVTITADYSAAKSCAYRRFVQVHYPRRGLVEATIEITSTVSLDLRNMRISFSGIVVPSNLYAFNAAAEEGEPGASIPPIESGGVSVPAGFVVEVRNEVVTGGSTAAYLFGEWDDLGDTLRYEMEYERTSGSTGVQSVFAADGENFVRSGYLVDGQQYRVRLRAWGGGTPSNWTDYQLVTAVADPIAPGVVTGAAASGGAGQANFSWVAPNSANYTAVRIYINASNTFSGAMLVATEYGPPNIADGRVVTGLTAGTKYGFLVAINASGVPSAEAATGSFVVT
ncbi:hypothetical protein [Rhizobium wuzhouense]|uniref:hypothetical protein n=1 Tax=Rhizobium wuzhouense TaxID=1986026 RepID=UPI001FDF93DC|nr:hypothetical protein [Rhizobium wuzhouense]